MSTEYSSASARTPSARTTTAVERDGRRVFDDVQTALRRTEFADPPEGRHLGQWVRARLDHVLDDSVVETRTGTRECDVVVDGTVGVEIVDGLSTYGTAGLRNHLETVGRTYDYLVVFVHALPNDTRDAWWLVKQQCTPRSLGVTDVGFVKPEIEEEPETQRSPAWAWVLVGPAVAFVLCYLAVGVTASTRITTNPMLVLIVPVIGIVVLLIFVLKSFGDT